MENDILTPREKRRYAKQIMLAEIGEAGQAKIKNSSVLVIGAGGLGCAVLQYLTVAGTGKIGIAEFDMVDESNLQRQVLYGLNDVGRLKSIIAKSRLEQLNSSTRIELFNLRIDSSNALNIIKDFDMVVDATDNYEVRYIISDSCVLANKPMVHGSIYKYEGLVAVFNYMGGPTYRSYNPEQQDKNYRNPLPSEVGLFGVLPGITGTLMANEVIKIITGTGKILSGKVLLFNIMNNTFTTFSVNSMSENPGTNRLNSL